MAINKPVWGIDLGQCALKALRLRAAGDKVEVLDHVYIEHSKILSQPDADRQALIDEAVKQFVEKHDLSNEIIVVSVPGQHTLARFTKLPPVDIRKIPEIVKYEAQQQIPFDMEEVIWDYQVFEDPEGMEPEVGIFAMRRELLRDQLRFLSNLNLEPAAVQSAPLALYNALRFDGQFGAESVTILDIGALNTDLIVVDGKSLWTRNIPIGGNNFTESLLKTFKLSFNKAENLKRTAASSKYARQIFQAMRPVFADLVAEIQRSIGFFTSSRRGVKLGKLIAMGNAFKLPGMQKFIQQNLGMEVVRPTTFNKLSVSEAPNAPQLIDHLLSFGVAYGAALQGLRLSQITSNLLPTEIAKQIVWRKKVPWFYGSAACLALAAGLVWTRNISDRSALQAATAGQKDYTIEPNYEQNDENRENPEINSRALDIIEKEPVVASPREYAVFVQAAGKHLSAILSEEQSKNKKEILEAEDIAKLNSHKTIWPKILDMIHSALPVPDAELVKAMEAGPEAYKKFLESNPEKYKRSQRKQIFIERLESSSFSTDVMADFEARRGRRAQPGSGSIGYAAAREAETSSPLNGFLITIIGRTPNEGGVNFVTKSFTTNLRNKAFKDVYVADALLLDIRPVKHVGAMTSYASTGKKYSTVRSSGSPTRRLAPDMTSGSVSVSGEEEADKDPITGETINDYEFEIILAVVLGEKPAEAEGQNKPDQEAGSN